MNVDGSKLIWNFQRNTDLDCTVNHNAMIDISSPLGHHTSRKANYVFLRKRETNTGALQFIWVTSRTRLTFMRY